MRFTLKQGIVLATLFTVLAPLIVLNWAKLGIGQEQKSQASAVKKQPINPAIAENKQQRSNSQAPLVAEIAYQYAAAQRSSSALKVLDQSLNLTDTTLSDCYKSTPLMRVANGYILAGETTKGQKLLTRAFQIAREQTIANCRLSATSPQESLLNRAVEYAEAGDYNFALSIIDGVDNLARPMLMARIAGIYWQDQKPEQARQIIGRALEIAQSQRIPDPIMRRQILMSIGFPLSEGGYPELLPPVIKQIQESFNSKDKPKSEDEASEKLYQRINLAKMLIATGEKAQAIALLNQVLPEIQALPAANSTPKILHLTQVAIQYAAAGQPEQAKTLLVNARTSAESSKSAMNRDQALATVARAYAEIGQVETANDLARQIKSVDNREQALGAIALHYAKTGKISQATTIARSLKTAKNLTLSSIVEYLLTTKQYEQALQVARQEKVDSILPQVALAFVEAGKPQQALQIAESIKAKEPARQSNHLDWLMPAIAQSFAKQGQFEPALKLAQRIQTKENKSHALTMIAAQYLKIDRIANQNKATEILDQAWKIALSNS